MITSQIGRRSETVDTTDSRAISDRSKGNNQRHSETALSIVIGDGVVGTVFIGSEP